MQSTRLIWYLAAFRISIALLCSTVFHPDEFYQSIEIAHDIVFGYGWKTWEWQPEIALRSPLYALVFVPGYWLVKILGLERTRALIIAPKMTQGIIAAGNDYYTAKLASKLFGDEEHFRAALFCSLASFFNAGATIRTLANSAETALVAAALSFWPWATLGSFKPALLLAGTTCFMRPTSAVLWVMLILTVAYRGTSACIKLLRDLTLPLILCTTIGLAVDTWYYQRLTFTPWNFFQINILNGRALFYGSEPWHFHLSQSLPMLTLALLPFTLHGFYITLSQPGNNSAREATWTAIGTIGIFSLIGHKEWRFIQLLLPIYHCSAAHSLITLSTPLSKEEAYAFLPRVKRSLVKLIIAINVPAALYFLLLHQKSQISISNYIRSLPVGEIRSLGFLMGCHSTPWQSHLHRPELERRNLTSGYGGMLWGITCDPPTNSSIEPYLNDHIRFTSDPCKFLDDAFPDSVDVRFPESKGASANGVLGDYSWPSHLAVFRELSPVQCPTTNESIGSRFSRLGYGEKAQFRNALHFSLPSDTLLFEHSSVAP